MTSQIIHLTKIFLIKLQSLPLEQQQQAIDFVEFLVQKYTSSVHAQLPPNRRTLGLHQGMGQMSDDFNAPLPDEFWMGES